MEHAVLLYRDVGRQCVLQLSLSCSTLITKNSLFFSSTSCPLGFSNLSGDHGVSGNDLASQWRLLHRRKRRGAAGSLTPLDRRWSLNSSPRLIWTELRSGPHRNSYPEEATIYQRLRGSRIRSLNTGDVDGENGEDGTSRNYYENVQDVEGPILEVGGVSVSRQLLWTIVTACLTVSFSVSNKILYKMALVPMAAYPFFMAQLTTFGYVAVYFTILYIRYRAGIVTSEMLRLPKGRIAAIGGLEALALSSGMAAAVVLPGAAIPILTQVFLVWQLILSYTFLGKKYTLPQLAGCLLVVVGVVIVVASGNSGGSALQQLQVSWSMLMILSTGFSAAANILKESVFQIAEKRMQGGVDIFVVNSFGSGFQALFVLLLLPFLSNLRGIPFHQLPACMKEAAGCFLNVSSLAKACDGAPLVPLLYILVNLSFNVAALTLLKRTSAVVASLVMTLSVPLGVWGFTWSLPYLGPPSKLPPGIWMGASILVCGLAVYNFSSQTVEAKAL